MAPRKSKVATEDSDSDYGSDSEDDECKQCGATLAPNTKFCGKCGAKREVKSRVSPRCCACSCGICCCVFIGLVVLLTLTFNWWLKYAIEGVGTALTGTPVTLNAVNLNAITGRVTLTDLAVASPNGYEGRNFFFVNRFVFDVGPRTLLTDPILLEEMTLNDLETFISLRVLPSVESNAGEILGHIKQVAGVVAPGLTTLPPLPDAETTLRIMQRKIIVNKLLLSNISVTAKVVALPEAKFSMCNISLTDIGSKSNGVYLFQFMEIVVQAVLMSAMKAAPAAVRAVMASDFGQDLQRGQLDIGDLHFDLGNGLQEITAFSGWATAEAATLPLRMAGAGASMTEKALEFGNSITGMATDAQMKATETEADIGIKATEEMAHLTNVFTNGFTNALTR